MTTQEGLAHGGGSSRATKEHRRMNELISVIAFGLFAVLWIAFGYAIVAQQGSLDDAWRWIRELPLPGQIVVGLLTLPVTIGLWIWETSWPFIVRLLLVAGIGAWNLYAFFPRFLVGR
jgi:hypothetical protein